MGRRWIGLWLVALLGLSGCMLPAKGTRVFVDNRAGSFWSGEAMLTAVSDDDKRCKVSVRDRALFVREMWVDCRHVHPRS